MVADREFTLTEVGRILDVPQHRLIHLVEKGAVVPDLSQAHGRGTSRRFSARNLLEFAIALELRKATISVAAAAAVIHVLRAFERRVAKEISGFTLPDSLRSAGAPDLRIVLSDARRLFFTLALGKGGTKVFGDVDLDRLVLSDGVIRGVPRSFAHLKPAVGDFGSPEGSRHSRLEVSVTRIARDLPLE